MKKINMLKKNYEFKKVLSKGKYYGGEQLEAFVINNNKNCNLTGIAISKKNGKSVIRNKIKRLIRESYNLVEKRLNTGYSIVILWKKKVPGESANFYIIKNDMEKILENAGILKRGEK